jgi:uncharacterized protein
MGERIGMDTNVNLINNKIEGYFEINYQYDGIYITVFPPTGKGLRVTVDDVLERLNRKRVNFINRKKVEEAVALANKVPVKIADPQE